MAAWPLCWRLMLETAASNLDCFDQAARWKHPRFGPSVTSFWRFRSMIRFRGKRCCGWTDGGTTGVVISGSNPPVVQRLLDNWNLGPTRPLAIRNCVSIPVVADVDFPERVGLDRLLNGVAVNAIRPTSRAAIVVDSGTATTVDYVSANGVFCGGAILPGMELCAKSLHDYTALLPLLSVQELGGVGPVAPGRNTHDAIRNGLFWGQVGAIRELIRQLCLQRGHRVPSFESENSDPNAPWLVLTGGGGPVLSPQFPSALRLASLGMHGLVLTAWRQSASEG